MTTGQIIGGIVLIFIGIIGLFIAAGASDAYMSFVGWALFFGTLWFNLREVSRYWDKKEHTIPKKH